MIIMIINCDFEYQLFKFSIATNPFIFHWIWRGSKKLCKTLISTLFTVIDVGAFRGDLKVAPLSAWARNVLFSEAGKKRLNNILDPALINNCNIQFVKCKAKKKPIFYPLNIWLTYLFVYSTLRAIIRSGFV